MPGTIEEKAFGSLTLSQGGKYGYCGDKASGTYKRSELSSGDYVDGDETYTKTR